MEIIPAVGEAEKLGTQLLVLGIFCDAPLTGSAWAVNQRSAGGLAAMLDKDGLGEAVGETWPVGSLPGVAAQRLLLVGLGRAGNFSEGAYRRALAAVAVALNDDPANEVVVTLAENEVPRRTLSWRMRQAGRLLADGRYDFGLPDRRMREDKRSIMLLVPQTLTSELVGALRQGVAIGEGVSFAKELGDLPPDLCTPAFIARTVETMASQFGFSVEVLGRREFEKHDMAAFLAGEKVATGACKLIVMRSMHRMATGRPIVLVGDGVAALEALPEHEQRVHRAPIRDMRGIGSVLGAMRTVERLGLALNVVGLIVASQGGPSQVAGGSTGGAPEPSLLGDVLSYAAHFSPSCVIDVAALTRACAVALGSQASGLFANDEALASELMKCGGTSGDRVWQLPLWDDDLPCAFVRGGIDQTAGSPPDAVAAASSLARFATAYPWAHLDISGTASTADPLRSSTGRPVPLLAEFLIGRARSTRRRPAFSPRPRTELHS
ncbi:putative cytosol aminopeptidase [Hyphomicrobiales bacterium]|nr:putative cytosol aminopeptidase [Hyphomicrobiales bacterium]CAH1698767.1 putative cytosol aminopeptidase [Hyphomicrobiales bacterium]CAI0342414.1 putative cytosol aminopeptidase [Hyphomicrobiales bacterium]